MISSARSITVWWSTPMGHGSLFPYVGDSAVDKLVRLLPQMYRLTELHGTYQGEQAQVMEASKRNGYPPAQRATSCRRRRRSPHPGQPSSASLPTAPRRRPPAEPPGGGGVMMTRQEIWNLIDRRQAELLQLCSDMIRIPSVNPPGDVSEIVRYITPRRRPPAEPPQRGRRPDRISCPRFPAPA